MFPSPSATEQELESLTQFLYIAPIGLVQASMDGEILLINPRSAQLLMPLAPRGELTHLFDVLEDIAPDLRLRAESHTAPCGPVCENMPLRVVGGAPGCRKPQVLSLTLLKLDASRLMAVIDDISDEGEAEASLRDSVAVDCLTGLANRWAFFEAAEAQWRRSAGAATPRPLALMLLDVDRPPAPDAEGNRAAGDAALRHVATHLAAAVGTGVLPARIGYARFAVLLPDLLPAAVQALAGRLCRAIAEAPLQLDGALPWTVTARAGIAAVQAGVTDIDDLLDRAATTVGDF